jgi:hypothetical protein
MRQEIIAGLLGLGLPAAVSIGVWLFAKFAPKEKTYETRIRPIVQKSARLVSKFGNIRLGSDAEKKIEEGVISTLVYWISSAANDWYMALIEDNDNAALKKELIQSSVLLNVADKELSK